MLKGILLYIFLIISTLGICQSPLRLSFHHLTREEGLSNNNSMYMYRDSRGFLWLSTFNGINRFDGIGCKVYKPTNSGIKGINFQNIIEDKNGNLWVGSEAGLNFYDRQKDEFIPINSPTNEKVFHSFPHAIDDKGLLWVILNNIKKSGLYTYEPLSKKFIFITENISEHISYNQNTHFQSIKTIFCGGESEIGLRKISFQGNKVTKIETFFDGKTNLPIFKNIKEYLFLENDSTLWITGNTLGLVKFNPLKNSFKSFNNFDKTTIKLLNKAAQYKNYLLIGALEGLYVFDKKLEKFVQFIQHSATNPRSLMANWNELPYVDKDDNLFLSQLGFGVDYTNLNSVLAENWLTSEEGFADNHVVLIFKRGDESWIKFQNGNDTFVLDNNGKIVKKYKKLSPVFVDSDNRCWLSDGHFFLLINPDKKIHKKLIFKELAEKMGWQITMTEINKGKYIIACAKGLFEFNELTNELSPLEEFNKEKSITNSPIFYDKTSQQLLVSSDWWSNFYVLKNENNTWKIRKKIKFPFTIVAIRAANNPKKLWLGTGKGLALFDTQSLDYQLFTEKNGLPDNAVTDIVEEPNGDYWLVTNSGISYYNKQKNEYQNFTSKDGANSNEYDWNSAFKLSDGRIIFGGTNGITVINQNSLERYHIAPKIQITQLLVNEKPLKTATYIGETSEIELQPNQNSFALDLVGIEYGSLQKLKIKYQLQGSDNQWITAKNPTTAHYTNVPEGTYKFLVKATDENEKVSSATRTLTIIVNAPFYRTLWFRILLVLGFIGLGYLLFRLRAKQIREEIQKTEEIKRIKAEAEINALRSQMNPHFIFNCLNTVDSYILLNKTDEASEFLNKFSKLIRMILENSRQEFVPLEQDLRALELYIKLEQERSYPQFKYEIKIDEKLKEQEYYIPSMLLQPFVENAILHGLRHKKDGGGKLSIDIQMVDNQLIIHILDNGIGREAAQKINLSKSQNKSSVGILLTKERIQKLNEIFPEKAYLSVNDINEENNKGTIIEIGLPLITHENLQIPR